MAGGRPSKYKAEYAEQAYKFCLLGATDIQLAQFFDVNELTINRWKDDHPEFCKSLKDGKKLADAKVAQSLYHRATGYSHPEVITATHQGQITDTMEVIKHYPPDTTAGIFWLKNRDKENWRDKQEVDSNNTNNNLNQDVGGLSADERRARIDELDRRRRVGANNTT